MLETKPTVKRVITQQLLGNGMDPVRMRGDKIVRIKGRMISPRSLKEKQSKKLAL